MRALVLAPALMLGALALACDGGGDEPKVVATLTPSALEIWARSMAALERVNAVTDHPGFPQVDELERKRVTIVRPSHERGQIGWFDDQPVPGFPSHTSAPRAHPPPAGKPAAQRFEARKPRDSSRGVRKSPPVLSNAHPSGLP